MGIHEIGFWTGTSVSIILIIVIINAFNLIDGIDGLASGLAIFSASALGTWFYLSTNYAYAILSFVV